MQSYLKKIRSLTWRWRSLPDFMIIGAQKAGTTSLFDYLSQHPQLAPAFKKEVHFFDGGINPDIETYPEGAGWYQSHFPLKISLGSGAKVYEASPLYIFNPLVPQRIYRDLPNVKIIAMLRNPTERAISHYFHVKQRGKEPLSIMEALFAEDERLQKIIESRDYKNIDYRLYSYKSRGLYFQQLSRYFECFSEHNCLVLNSEMLFSDPQKTLKKVFEFVGVDTDQEIKNLKPKNVGRIKKNVNNDVYEYLDDFFAPHNKLLYELIKEDYGW